MTKINHIGIYVSDLEKSREFYEYWLKGVAGTLYENPAKGFKSYILNFGNGATLELMTKTGIHGQQALGQCHVSFSVGSRERVDWLTNRMKAAGIPVLDGPRTTGDGFYESTITDPDGNIIELTV